MTTLTRDEADLKLAWRVLTEELYTVKPWNDEYPKRFRWVLDADMLSWLKRLATAVPWEASPGPVAETLVGYPVEIRDGVQGIHLVEAVA